MGPPNHLLQNLPVQLGKPPPFPPPGPQEGFWAQNPPPFPQWKYYLFWASKCGKLIIFSSLSQLTNYRSVYYGVCTHAMSHTQLAVLCYTLPSMSFCHTRTGYA